MKRALALCCGLLFAVSACATMIVPMSVEELTRASADVVEATALRTWSTWNAQHTLLYTFTEFAVTSRLKGSAPDKVVVKQMGGHADGIIQRVAGVRYFQAGEETLLFLRPSAARDGSEVIVGLVQGNFRVWRAQDGRRMASNGIRGVSELHGREVRTFAGSASEISTLESRVRKAAQR